MPLLSTSQVPPPKNWQDFENLCADLWQEKWQDCFIQRYGRSGQAQQGVDIVCRESGMNNDGWTGIQCKCIDASTVLDRNILLAEIENAKGF
jgi:Restriction endonuclease